MRSVALLPLFVLLLGAAAPASRGVGDEADGGCAQALSPASAAALEARLLLGLYDAPAGARRLHVALALHVVRASDGSGGVGREQLTQAVRDANAAFAPAGIVFVPLPIDVIEDDALVSIDDWTELQALKRVNAVPLAINVWFVESLLGVYCGVSSYSSDPEQVQGIVVANACAGTPRNPSTVPHEIGHYLDLLHTFEGAYGAGCTSGADCRTTGDLRCDTPAEPPPLSGAGTPPPACAYVGAAAPPCPGDPPYAPDLTSLMSGGLPSCRTHLTRDQLRRARATLVLLRPELILGS